MISLRIPYEVYKKLEVNPGEEFEIEAFGQKFIYYITRIIIQPSQIQIMSQVNTEVVVEAEIPYGR